MQKRYQISAVMAPLVYAEAVATSYMLPED